MAPIDILGWKSCLHLRRGITLRRAEQHEEVDQEATPVRLAHLILWAGLKGRDEEKALPIAHAAQGKGERTPLKYLSLKFRHFEPTFICLNMPKLLDS